ATAGITKAIAMTTLQKTLIAVTLVTATGGAIFEAHKASTLRAQIESLQQQQAPQAAQIQQLQGERDDAAGQLSGLRAENARLNGNSSELLRLRNELAQLRRDQSAREPGVAPAPGIISFNNP